MEFFISDEARIRVQNELTLHPSEIISPNPTPYNLHKPSPTGIPLFSDEDVTDWIDLMEQFFSYNSIRPDMKLFVEEFAKKLELRFGKYIQPTLRFNIWEAAPVNSSVTESEELEGDVVVESEEKSSNETFEEYESSGSKVEIDSLEIEVSTPLTETSKSDTNVAEYVGKTHCVDDNVVSLEILVHASDNLNGAVFIGLNETNRENVEPLVDLNQFWDGGFGHNPFHFDPGGIKCPVSIASVDEFVHSDYQYADVKLGIKHDDYDHNELLSVDELIKTVTDDTIMDDSTLVLDEEVPVCKGVVPQVVSYVELNNEVEQNEINNGILKTMGESEIDFCVMDYDSKFAIDPGIPSEAHYLITGSPAFDECFTVLRSSENELEAGMNGVDNKENYGSLIVIEPGGTVNCCIGNTIGLRVFSVNDDISSPMNEFLDVDCKPLKGMIADVNVSFEFVNSPCVFLDGNEYNTVVKDDVYVGVAEKTITGTLVWLNELMDTNVERVQRRDDVALMLLVNTMMNKFGLNHFWDGENGPNSFHVDPGGIGCAIDVDVSPANYNVTCVILFGRESTSFRMKKFVKSGIDTVVVALNPSHDYDVSNAVLMPCDESSSLRDMLAYVFDHFGRRSLLFCEDHSCVFRLFRANILLKSGNEIKIVELRNFQPKKLVLLEYMLNSGAPVLLLHLNKGNVRYCTFTTIIEHVLVYVCGLPLDANAMAADVKTVPERNPSLFYLVSQILGARSWRLKLLNLAARNSQIVVEFELLLWLRIAVSYSLPDLEDKGSFYGELVVNKVLWHALKTLEYMQPCSLYYFGEISFFLLLSCHGEKRAEPYFKIFILQQISVDKFINDFDSEIRGLLNSCQVAYGHEIAKQGSGRSTAANIRMGAFCDGNNISIIAEYWKMAAQNPPQNESGTVRNHGAFVVRTGLVLSGSLEDKTVFKRGGLSCPWSKITENRKVGTRVSIQKIGGL
ncbi:OLC1v1006114C1 [Oldenlandia corymbosa var. corymbosa]|uniref:OLC1v1006114C1 n=1 Tax=Oldenlandia corymbosa var. corymbosa TaxID=529605 RepID=A0AAV1DIL8_OLDCO|nr:OLC1v1006114C1 [Oldenlandia corymbosa var. corymbosa]